jgi:hypothetical protein
VFHLPPGIAPPGAPPRTAAPDTISPGVPDHGVGRLLFPPTGNNQDGSSAAGVGGRRVVEVLKGTLSALLLTYFCLLVYGIRHPFVQVRYATGPREQEPVLWIRDILVRIRIRGFRIKSIIWPSIWLKWIQIRIRIRTHQNDADLIRHNTGIKGDSTLLNR